MIQIAMKTALDVFLFQVPCKLMCFLNPAKVITQEEFQTSWQAIAPTQQVQLSLSASELYGGYANNTEQALVDGLGANGFACVRKVPDEQGRISYFFGAFTVNNLPVLF